MLDGSQSRSLGGLWSDHNPCLFRFRRSSTKTGSISESGTRRHFRYLRQPRRPNPAPGLPLSCDHGPISFASVEILLRPQVCTLPLSARPGFSSGLAKGSTAPSSLSLLEAVWRSRIQAFWPALSGVRFLSLVESGSLFALTKALSTRVSWTRVWLVSLSSVETLRLALVCKLPLSAPRNF